ncbi:head-tail connector protein [Acidovorax sp. CF316]|uniref:head-tail connector protein n=1 Tax=Acidovorax sp. CF316 TaxID=1144317 RepID=UPI0002EFA4CE|nr:head-tail connector protein [Acidovorax sp. CF316]
MVPLPTALAHLRADGAGEDALITTYLEAAEEAASDYLNRKLYATQDDLDAAVLAETAGLDPMVMGPAVRSAVLLILGHLYANREDVVAGVTVAELPQGSKALLRPHRRIAGL